MDPERATQTGNAIMRVRAVFDWITERLIPPPLEPRHADETERQEGRQADQESRASVARTNRVVDTWNERTRENWRTDGYAR